MRTAILLLGLALPSLAADRPTWPQWRGPNRDSSSPGTPFPDKLSSLKQLWRVELGPSYSGPIVLENRVIVTETVDEKTEVVRALDRDTGQELWKGSWPGAMKVIELASSRGNWIRATPASDGQVVCVAGMRDVLVCLDAKDGKERWRVDFVKEFGTPLPMFGMVSSPQIDGDAVYTLAAGGIVRVDARSGQVAWRTLTDDLKEEGGATASVVVGPLAGQKRVVALNRKHLAVLDPDTGTTLWKQTVPAYRGTTTITPVLVSDAGVFVSMIAGRSMRFDFASAGDKLTGRRAWDITPQAYMSTPVLVGNHLFAHLENQRLTCLDAKSGRARWTTDELFGEYWSMVTRGERILALDQKGELILFRATPDKFDLLDRRKISEVDTWAHLAVCGDELYVRDLKGITAYRWPR